MKDQRVSMRLRWEGAVGDNGLMMDVNPYQAPIEADPRQMPHGPGWTPTSRLFLKGTLLGCVLGYVFAWLMMPDFAQESLFAQIILFGYGAFYGGIGGTLLSAFGIVVYRRIYPEPNDASRDAVRGSNQESAPQPQPFAPQ